MPTGYNLAEGGSNGVAPTVGNTGGASGDAVNTVETASTDTILCSTAAAKFGTLGYRFTLGASGTGATRMRWSMPTSSRHVFSFYWSIDTLPTSTEDVGGFRHGSGNMCVLQIGADGKLILANTLGSGITASKSTLAIAAATLYRIDLVTKPGTTGTADGTMGYAYYAVATSDSTPVQSYESAVQNVGLNAISNGFIGRSTGRTQAHVIDYDCIRWDTLASGFMAAYAPPAVSANAGVDITTVEPGSTVTLDGTGSIGASTYAWTQTLGTTVTLTGASTTTPTFTAPNTLSGETLRFRLTVDGGSVDDVDVVVLLNTERIAVGGVLTPTLLKLAVPTPTLTNWYAALANRANAAAKIVIIGDSISEGTGSGGWSLRWQQLLQDRLRSAFPTSGVPGAGYIPALTAFSPGPPVTISGSGGPATVFTGQGLGLKQYKINSSHFVQWNAQQCDRVYIHYSKNSSTGGAIVSVDAVDTGAQISSNAAAADGFVWDSGALTAGSHTIKVRGNAAFGALISAAEFFNGDLTKGIRVYDGAHFGFTSASFIVAGADTGHWQVMATIQPQLIVYALGVNDWVVARTPATFLANVDTALAKIATALGATPYSVLLVSEYRPGLNGLSSADWTAYNAGLAARAVGNVGYLNWQTTWPALVADGSTNAGLMFETTNPTHPSTAGHDKIADLMLAAVSP